MLGLYKGKIFIAAVSLYALFLLSSCILPPHFKDEVIVNNKLQLTYIRNIARQSSDIFDFVQKIYATISVDREYRVVHQAISKKLSIDDLFAYSWTDWDSYAWDRDVFKEYCSVKNGKVFSLELFSGSGISYFWGISRKFYTCEINGEVDAALIYEVYKGNSGEYPYEIIKKYSKKEGFYKLLKEYKLEGFTSNDMVITIPLTQINRPLKSDEYVLIFNYYNNTSAPEIFDFLNTNYVNIKGLRYDIDFRLESEPKKVKWTSFNPEAFVTKGDFSKVRVQPKQNVTGIIAFRIPSVISLKEEDLSDLVISIDNRIYTNFKKVFLYEVLKKEIK